MKKYKLATTSKFRKEYKKMLKRNYDPALLETIVDMLLDGQELPQKNCDHELTGNLDGYRECHIQPDWLLIYKVHDDILVLTLTRTGTHSDLFNK